jgi:curli biogenesis system outer membrane secretion channel CsgG
MRTASLTLLCLAAVSPAIAQDRDPPKTASGKRAADRPGTPSPLKPYFGPLRRAAVTAMEVKVQGVTTTAPTPSGTTTVVTLDIQQPTEFGTGLSDMLTTALVASKRFVVLDRLHLDEVQKETTLSLGPNVDPATAIQGARLLGAQVIVRGAVTEFSVKRSGSGVGLASDALTFGRSTARASIAIDLTIIDIATGRVLDSVRAEGKAESKAQSVQITVSRVKLGESSFDNSPLGLAVRNAIDDGVRKICQKTEGLPWEARVAAVTDSDSGPKLYVNVGKDAGLMPGDILEVARAGKDIIDPDSRIVLGRTRGKKVGRCRVEEVQQRVTIVAPIDGSGYQEEDVVTFVERPGRPRED